MCKQLNKNKDRRIGRVLKWVLVRRFGTFWKRVTCRYRLMIWHILYVVYCIDQGARGVSSCQEASFVGCAVFVFACAQGCRRRACATACRWRAGPGHLLFPRNLHVYQRGSERGKSESVHSSRPHCQGFTEHKPTAPHTRDCHMEQVPLLVCGRVGVDMLPTRSHLLGSVFVARSVSKRRAWPVGKSQEVYKRQSQAAGARWEHQRTAGALEKQVTYGGGLQPFLAA